ncbi:MFS transporter [Desulfitobacterium hafniense]|uniref:Major facilitator superfamily (MFS) profile domain-containing protein n=1 Tax=Desulfitobacterium hafniense (strain Y51) TaxID=138119 RepID=Q24Z55_DESHY|nr:MFS transporter [Desulfitobacterium hafniense]BAE82687.1 hypothetical protein DSY0898 [Desulfitobacterium hafniense Y51]
MLKNNKILSQLALLSILFLPAGKAAATPALQNISEAFPNAARSAVMLISTLPSLVAIPFALLTGAVVGKKFNYKSMALMGTALIMVGGVTPAFINHEINIILLARAVFGAGIGIMMPLGKLLILKLFDGQARANMLGASAMVGNGGAVFFLMAGSVLCTFNWKYTFYAYLVAALPLIVVFFFLREPEKEETVKN